MPATILLAEDEAAIAETVLYALRADGFEAEHVLLGGQVLPRLARGGIDLVILDVGLPDRSGFDVCRELRDASAVPVVFLTARSDEIDRVLGLELTRYEHALLAELLRRPGAILSRAQLLDRVWADALESGERTVDTHVKTLRAKLRQLDPARDPIRTHRGLGYSVDVD